MILAQLLLAATVAVGEPVVLQSPAPPVRVGSEIKAPKKVKGAAPEYPAEAVRAGLRGLVLLECTLDTHGIVHDVRLLMGVPPLTDAAIKAVKKWRFEPTLLNGVAVPVIMTVSVNFTRDRHFRLSDLLESLTTRMSSYGHRR